MKEKVSCVNRKECKVVKCQHRLAHFFLSGACDCDCDNDGGVAGAQCVLVGSIKKQEKEKSLKVKIKDNPERELRLAVLLLERWLNGPESYSNLYKETEVYLKKQRENL